MNTIGYRLEYYRGMIRGQNLFPCRDSLLAHIQYLRSMGLVDQNMRVFHVTEESLPIDTIGVVHTGRLT